MKNNFRHKLSYNCKLYKLTKTGKFIYDQSLVYNMNVTSIVGNYIRTVYKFNDIHYNKFKYIIFGFAIYNKDIINDDLYNIFS